MSSNRIHGGPAARAIQVRFGRRKSRGKGGRGVFKLSSKVMKLVKCFQEMVNTESFNHLMSLPAPRTIVKVSFFLSDL